VGWSLDAEDSVNPEATGDRKSRDNRPDLNQ
jgi:hypothetical protein